MVKEKDRNDNNLDKLVDYSSKEGFFLAKPKQKGKYPGIVMIHEWWGLNEYIKHTAKILAKEGYIVYAVDLFNGHVAKDINMANILSSGVKNNPVDALRKLKYAVKFLKDNYNVTKVASIGWCFGGGQSLNLSLHEKLDATVIYYGSLITDKEQLMNLNAVLGIFGDKDKIIPLPLVNSFRKILNELSIENEIYIYKGVGHAFANPSGANYSRNQTVDAWKKTLHFLHHHLK